MGRAGARGALAQLGEHLLCKQRVIGSIPIGSTKFFGSRQQAHRGAFAHLIRQMIDIVERETSAPLAPRVRGCPGRFVRLWKVALSKSSTLTAVLSVVNQRGRHGKLR